jgi:hypothetical protein
MPLDQIQPPDELISSWALILKEKIKVSWFQTLEK